MLFETVQDNRLCAIEEPSNSVTRKKWTVKTIRSIACHSRLRAVVLSLSKMALLRKAVGKNHPISGYGTARCTGPSMADTPGPQFWQAPVLSTFCYSPSFTCSGSDPGTVTVDTYCLCNGRSHLPWVLLQTTTSSCWKTVLFQSALYIGPVKKQLFLRNLFFKFALLMNVNLKKVMSVCEHVRLVTKKNN